MIMQDSHIGIVQTTNPYGIASYHTTTCNGTSKPKHRKSLNTNNTNFTENG